MEDTRDYTVDYIDYTNNISYKKFTTLRRHLMKQINNIILELHKRLQFLGQGKTHIKPKNQETQDPARPTVANQPPITKARKCNACSGLMDELNTDLIATRSQKENRFLKYAFYCVAFTDSEMHPELAHLTRAKIG